jgi:hypothetical protein
MFERQAQTAWVVEGTLSLKADSPLARIRTASVNPDEDSRGESIKHRPVRMCQ